MLLQPLVFVCVQHVVLQPWVQRCNSPPADSRVRMRKAGLTDAHQVHEAIHAVADLEEDVPPLPHGLRAERRPQQPGDAGHQEERAQEHSNDLHLLHQGDGDGLPLGPKRKSSRM